MLVIPHPDDAEGGVGGTVAKWVAEGTEVVFVLCTNGDKGTSDPEMTTEKLGAIREKEQAAAAECLGVKEVIYLRYGDGELDDTAKFRGELVRAIRKHRPDVVFCTDPFRQTFYLHRDHRISGQVTLDAVFPYARDFLHYNEHIQEGLETHKVGDILMWGTEHPDTFIDITDTIDNKINALKKHASQVAGSGRDVDRFVKVNAQNQGQMANMPYAEGFKRIRFRT
ncbi:Diacetylchitobiose deacetylase [Geodia barretti]|jgi:LmbE family N-acetylglucosaminyl deacetylase|uniref:N-acetylglucosaminylphosphatidylinositol deacetylase n=1 Tax=Geodia barretti TaxID=519541 RepID=A0AA35RD89_GEOBA|nr:Diacetylchitobiose deacetylase [Geodia barretti]